MAENKKTLTLMEGQELMDKKGMKMSIQGLSYAAKRDGFLSNMKPEKGRAKNLLDKDKFMAWLKNNTKPIPAGFKRIDAAANECNASITILYALAKEGAVPVINQGPGRGTTYVHVEKTKKVLVNRNKKVSDKSGKKDK